MRAIRNEYPIYEGFIPPADKATEEVVLGSILLEKDKLDEVIHVLQDSEIFYFEEHQLIYEAILQMRIDRTPIDIITVCHKLRKLGTLDRVGGAYTLSQLTAKIGSTSNLLWHSLIIYELYTERKALQISYEISQGISRGGESMGLIIQKSQDLKELFERIEGSSLQTLNDILLRVQNQIEDAKDMGGVVGVRTGYADLDNVTGGLQKGNVIVLAGRPGMGKTTLAMNIAENTAKRFGKKVGIFSIEMGADELARRMVAGNTQNSYNQLLSGNVGKHTMDEIKSTVADLATLPIYIVDTPAITLTTFETLAKQMVIKHQVDLIIIDYIQYVRSSSKGRSREQEVAEVSRGIKATAKELQVPILALAQLSREGAKGRPKLTDLRESGAIEQDADIVLFIHRPEVIGDTEKEDGTSTSGDAEVIIGKGRNIGRGNVRLRFDGERTRFYDFDNYGSEPPSNFRPLKNDNEF